jgi:hypothetical protein
MLDLLLVKVAAAEHYAHLAAAPHRTLKGLDPEINPEGLHFYSLHKNARNSHNS